MQNINDLKADVLNRLSQERVSLKGGGSMQNGQTDRVKSDYVKPGRRIVEVISALPGGRAEYMLRTIAHPVGDAMNPNNKRTFDPWQQDQEGVWVCRGSIQFVGGQQFPLTLKLGVKEGLFLRDAVGAGVSLKNHKRSELVLDIGEDFPIRRVGDVANQMVGTWVIHGENWKNRNDSVCNQPYGYDVTRPLSFAFKIEDGAQAKMTLEEFIARGGIRSAHAGQWNRPFTIIPAACGVPVILHEFKQTNEDIRNFLDQSITDQSHYVWGPYCNWSREGRSIVGALAPRWKRLVAESASPFTFHMQATKELFPNCVVASRFLLDATDSAQLEKILRMIVLEEPERMYRLIDAEGKTYILRQIKGGELMFSNGQRFSLLGAIENTLQTFYELAALDGNPTIQLPRIPRLVLDSHFYTVTFSLAHTSPDGQSAHDLSGSEMYRYMLKGKEADMHALRNDRLFQLLREYFPEAPEALQFFVYPPLGLPGVNQYTFNPEEFQKEPWLAKTL